MPTILRVDKKNTDPQEVVRILQAVKDGNADLSPENVVRFGQIKQRAGRNGDNEFVFNRVGHGQAFRCSRNICCHFGG
jgi:hypothetical protein